MNEGAKTKVLQQVCRARARRLSSLACAFTKDNETTKGGARYIL